MKPSGHSYAQFKDELDLLGKRHNVTLRNEDLFVAWYLLATTTDDEREALDGLGDSSNDGGIDGVLIDRNLNAVTLVQGKLRQSLGVTTESPKDLDYFFKWGRLLLEADATEFKSRTERLAPKVKKRLEEAREYLRRSRDARLHLHYASTGRVKPTARRERENDAWRLSREFDRTVKFRLVDGAQIMALFDTWMRSAAPPVDEIELEMLEAPIEIALRDGEVRTFLLTAAGDVIGRIGLEHKTRVFAKNIRGYLGQKTEVNKSMQFTIRNDPAHFWLMNNGITIVCSEAQRADRDGKKLFVLRHPQIINGQQTTRTLGEAGAAAKKTKVLVRIIEVRDDPRTAQLEHEAMISKIVRATNHQSAVKPSDLIVNDEKQIRLTREFRTLNYRYLRRREAGSEQSQKLGRGEKAVRLKELAAALGGCLECGLPLRAGKEKLFEPEIYDRIFGDDPDPRRLLCQVHLYRMVDELARRGLSMLRANGRRPKMAWNRSRWIVLYETWDALSSEVRRYRKDMLHLFDSNEVDGDPRQELRLGMVELFQCAEAFYEDTKEADDEPNRYFKRKEVHSNFRRWCRGKGRSRISAANRHFSKFVKLVEEIYE